VAAWIVVDTAEDTAVFWTFCSLLCVYIR